MQKSHSHRQDSRNQGFRRRLALIEALVFGLPFIGILYLFLLFQDRLDLSGWGALFPAGILLVVLAGLVLLRQVVERFVDFYDQVSDARCGEEALIPRGRILDFEEAARAVTAAIRKLESTNEELSRKVAGLSMMKELLHVTSDTVDMDVILKALLEKAMILAGSEIGSVFVAEPDGGLRLVHYKGPGEPPPEKFPCREDSPIMARVLRDAKPLVVTDIESDPRIRKPNNPRYVSPSFISIPLFAGYELAGVMNLARKENRDVFNEEDERLLSLVAKEMGFALQNAFLARRSRQQAGKIDLLTREMSTERARIAFLEEEKKLLTSQLTHAQKMQAIGTLVGGVAHDFNNVLMAIQGNVSLMLLDCAPNHDHFPRLKNIEKQVASGSRLTGRLLGYARKEPQRWRAVGINRLVRESAETFGRTRKDLSIDLCLAEDLATVHGDPDQVEQILWNLYINASDAMPDGGRITVTTENATREDLMGRNLPKPGPHVMLSVADTGMGIDPETIAHIFEPFFTTKAAGKGTGLGLASVYGIVKTHGGHIDAVSDGGQGAVFRVYLPAGQGAGAETDAATHSPVRGTGTILLVDDEESVRLVGEEMLTRLGYVVHPAAGGREALEIFRRFKDRIDGVILDLVMPEMGGSQVFEALRQESPGIRILLSSGFDEDERAAPLLMCGGAGFIQKPFTLDRLSEMLTSILNQVEV
ncbi:MAG: response regulator [Proteobacteria bacterium]|nr:response regulator [Pseudomonadota bacterium]